MESFFSLAGFKIFIFGFQHFYYHMSGYGYLCDILFVVCQLSWMYKLIFFIKIGEFLVLISLNIFSALFSTFGTPITCMLV